MAAVKACSVLITGANRGLGLEMVKQLSEVTCPKRQIFACCRDPDGPKSEKLRELAEKHPGIITIVRLDVGDPCSIKESATKVSSLLGKNGLNLLVNNAGVLAHGTMQSTTNQKMRDAFNTNLMGPFTVTKEFLPYLRTAAKASDTSGMSCDKAAVINISSQGGSMSTMPALYLQFPLFPYCVSKAGLNMLTLLAAQELKGDEILCMALHPGWVKTDMGGGNAPIEIRDSVAGMLQVMSGLTENKHGGFMDYDGQTLMWSLSCYQPTINHYKYDTTHQLKAVLRDGVADKLELMNMAAVKGCSALVTGANRGLGLEIVKQLLEAHCSIVFAGCRDPDGANSEALRELAKKHPGVVTLVCLDVADPSSIKESLKKVSSLLGNSGLNLLVNNAAVLQQKSMLNATVEEMQDTFNTNVIGPLLVTREFLPHLRSAAKTSSKPGMSCDKAAIINISSDTASMSLVHVEKAFPLFPYSISKAALNMLTAHTAMELKEDEILCVSIHPGWVKTDMGGDRAPLTPRDSVAGLLHVVSSLTEKEHGGFMDYTGKTMPW